jgi:hypothetical protein
MVSVRHLSSGVCCQRASGQTRNEEHHFANTERRERLQGVPVNAGGNLAVKDAQERVRGDILLGLDIGKAAIDQLDNQMALVSLRVQGLRVIPVERLRGGGWSSHHGQRKRLGRMRR